MQTKFENSMSLIVARLIRLFIGMLLPIPLFIAIYFFSYFYKSYHGYSFEIHSYLTDEMSLSNSRKLIWDDMFAFLLFGYVYMLIPSVLYSILLEVYRTKSFSCYIGYEMLGGIIGGLSGLLFIWINPGYSVVNIFDGFTAFVLSVFIGAGIAILLSFIGRPEFMSRTDGLKGDHLV